MRSSQFSDAIRLKCDDGYASLRYAGSSIVGFRWWSDYPLVGVKWWEWDVKVAGHQRTSGWVLKSSLSYVFYKLLFLNNFIRNTLTFPDSFDIGWLDERSYIIEKDIRSNVETVSKFKFLLWNFWTMKTCTVIRYVIVKNSAHAGMKLCV